MTELENTFSEGLIFHLVSVEPRAPAPGSWLKLAALLPTPVSGLHHHQLK